MAESIPVRSETYLSWPYDPINLYLYCNSCSQTVNNSGTQREPRNATLVYFTSDCDCSGDSEDVTLTTPLPETVGELLKCKGSRTSTLRGTCNKCNKQVQKMAQNKPP